MILKAGQLSCTLLNWGQYLLESDYVFKCMLSLLQHDILMCKMFILMFKCVLEAAGVRSGSKTYIPSSIGREGALWGQGGGRDQEEHWFGV